MRELTLESALNTGAIQLTQLIAEREQNKRLEAKIARLTEERDYYRRAFLLLSKTRKESDIRSAR